MVPPISLLVVDWLPPGTSNLGNQVSSFRKHVYHLGGHQFC